MFLCFLPTETLTNDILIEFPLSSAKWCLTSIREQAGGCEHNACMSLRGCERFTVACVWGLAVACVERGQPDPLHLSSSVMSSWS